MRHVSVFFYRRLLRFSRMSEQGSRRKRYISGAFMDQDSDAPKRFRLDNEMKGRTTNAAMACEHVIKSPNDKRQYRVITLENSMTALLISDLSDSANDEIKSESETEESESEEAEESSSDEDDDVEEDEEDENEDDGSPEKGRRKRKHSSSSQGEKLAAASLCIGSGSFSDPEHIPGLAHFLEHMVFMGSEKYPDENAFDAFIKKHGGNDNAYTDCENTVFYFDIEQKHFREALDIFAQLFTSPLLKKSAMDREIKAVDSEYEMNLPSDFARKQQLLSSMAKQGHPMGKFMWGNTQSLKIDPSLNNIDIYTHLQEFRKTMYSSHYMTLAVQSKETLDTLQEWVTNTFSQVPNNQTPRASFSHLTKPFDTSEFYKLYKVIPVKNLDQIEITWALPSLQKHYRVKPLHYLGWLIGHEGKGSLLSYLKKRMLALTITSGNGETGYDHNSTYAVMSVTINLTDSGFYSAYEVITAVFEYLDMLRRVGPQERIYKEIQTIESNEFRWQEQSEPVDYVENLSVSMQHFPQEDYLTGDQLMFEYNEEIIREIQDMLTPDKANIMILSKKYEDLDVCDKNEKWFQTPYCVMDIDPEWKKAWENLTPNPAFHLPEENAYIASDFSLKEPDGPGSKNPTPVLSNGQGQLWYKKDETFKVPKACLYFHLISPEVSKSPHTMAMHDIFVQILQQNLAEVAYAADVAQLSYSFKSPDTGLTIHLSGFNHKLPKLFETIVDHIANFTVTDELFGAIKRQLTKSYFNLYIKPNRLSREVRLSILEDHYWTLMDRHHIMDDLTKDKLLEFVQQFKSRLYVESLVHGNFTSQEALDLHNYLVEKLKCAELPTELIPQVRVRKVPERNNCCRVHTFNREDTNSVVTNYYQCGPGNVRDAVLNEIVILKMEEPCFDILRTREQLGYSVYCTHRATAGILGMSVTVCTQQNKFSTNEVDDHIEKFLQEFDHILQKMTQEEFESQVDALIMLKKCVDTHLSEEASRHWNEIQQQWYLFDRLDKEVDALRTLTLNEFKDWFRNHMIYDTRRKLSTQVIGSTIVTPDTPPVEPDGASNQSLETSMLELTTATPGKRKPRTRTKSVMECSEVCLEFVPDKEDNSYNQITDIQQFKKGLELLPFTVIK